MVFGSFVKGKFRIVARLLLIVLFFLFIGYSLASNTFDEKAFDENLAYKHISELSSERYEGRFAGTEGDRLTLSYIENYFKELGIAPGGDEGTFYQNFKDMLPKYNEEPILNVVDNRGNIIKKYRIGTDFGEEFTGYGGNGSVTGEIFPADKSLSLYKASDIRDKVILSRYTLKTTDIEYAMESGVKGIIASKPSESYRIVPKLYEKAGKTIPISYVTAEAYFELLDYAAEGLNVNMKLNMSFNHTNIQNVVGKIEGRKKESGYIIISAAIDGLGKDYTGSYYPGTLKNASGTGTMLEIARILSQQKNRCDETIIFIGWNNSYGSQIGFDYYAENPIYPLEKSKVIILDSMGYKYASDIGIFSNTEAGMALLNKFIMSGEDEGIGVKRNSKSFEFINKTYIKKDIPVVLIQSEPNLYTGESKVGTYKDDLTNINRVNLKKGGDLVLGYLNSEIYGDKLDILSGYKLAFLVLFILGILLLYFIEFAYKTNKKGKLYKFSMEDIYYSTPINLLQKVYKFLTPTLIILILLVFIASIPPSFKIVFGQNGTYTNISFYSVVKRSIGYIGNLMVEGFGKTLNYHNVTNVMGYSVIRSMKLLVSTLIFSFAVGTVMGIINGARRKERGGLRTLSTLIGISLPDVFIVVVAQIILIFLYKHHMLQFLNGRNEATRFIMPFLCMSIIPTGYISRLVEVFVREEMKKEYIKSAKAKGLSKFKILKNHILKGASFKVLDSMQTILTMLISNLIIIEYLFPYPGVAYNIFLFYRERDRNGFMGLVLALGLMYIFFIIMFKLIIKIVNPLKRRNA